MGNAIARGSAKRSVSKAMRSARSSRAPTGHGAVTRPNQASDASGKGGPSPLANFNMVASRTSKAEEDSRVIYTTPDDYEMMKAMENMSESERAQFEAELDKQYRAEYEQLQAELAKNELNDSAKPVHTFDFHGGSHGLSGGNRKTAQATGGSGTSHVALPAATLEFLKQQEVVKRLALEEQQRQEKIMAEFAPDNVESARDEDLVKRVTELAANIKEVYATHEIVGEMPEYMLGLKAKAKPERVGRGLSSQRQQRHGGSSGQQRERVTREGTGQSFNIYEPSDIVGVLSSKQLTVALDKIRDLNTRHLDQLDEHGNAPPTNDFIDRLSAKHGVDSAELRTILRYINSPYVHSLDNNVAFGLWHSPAFAVSVQRHNAMKGKFNK